MLLVQIQLYLNKIINMLLNTKIKPIDNSQIKLIKIIQYLPKKTKIGKFFTCALNKITTKFKFAKKNIYLGLITTWKIWHLKLDNVQTFFHLNSCVILNTGFKLLANKIQKPVSKAIFLQSKFNKLAFKKILNFVKVSL